MANIALVVLDTLRKDAFDEHFDWLPGVRFENAWSTSGWTVPVHASLFDGRYPSEAGVYAKAKMLDCEKAVLAERLSNAGFTTRGFSANANIADVFQFTRGFDEFFHSWRGRRQKPNVVDWGEFVSETRDEGPIRFVRAIKQCLRRDVNTIESLKLGVRMKAREMGFESLAGTDDGAKRALELVETTSFGDDEFLFLNLMEAHGPYNPPREYQTVSVETNPSFRHTVGDGPDEDHDDIVQAYDECVQYLSDVYADIFAAIRRDFDYVITVSDHGEVFGRDGVWGHNHGLYPELTHVPLVVYTGEDRTETRDVTVSLVDVYRTVLGIAGLTDEDARGRDLLAERESRRYLTERHGLRSGRASRLIENGYDEKTVERFDRDVYGAVEENGGYGWDVDGSLATCNGADRDAIGTTIAEIREELNKANVTVEESFDVPDDVQNRLAELGYI